MDGKNLFQVFFFLNLIIFPFAQKVGAGAQKSGGAAALLPLRGPCNNSWKF